MQVFSTLCLAIAAVVAVAKGAGVDPGLPDPKPTVPGWYYDESDTYTAQFQYYNSPAAITSLPTQDYAVIGGGWSGVSTANWLAKLGGASKAITLLEARGISDGASGRNLGWMAPRSFVHYNASVAAVGKANTLQQVTFERQIAEEVFNLTLTLPVLPGVSEILRTGRFLVYTTVVQSEFNTALSDYNQFRKDSGLTDQIYIPADTCLGLFPTVNNLAGCFWISEHYRLRTPTLVWALFNNMMSTYSNVHSYTRAPVTKITSAGTGTSKLYTIYVNNTAMLKAKNIAFTANAWTSHLLPALQYNTSAPYFIFSAQQQVLQSNPLYPVFTGYACVEFADDVYGLWQRESGAFINAQGFGFLNSSDSGIDPSQVTGPVDETGQVGGGALTFLKTVYPKDASATADHVWTGVQGYTSDSQPFVGPLQASSPTLWISSGFNGHGNPRAYGCGRALAQQMLGLTVSPVLPNVYQTQTRSGFYTWALTGATFN